MPFVCGTTSLAGILGGMVGYGVGVPASTSLLVYIKKLHGSRFATRPGAERVALPLLMAWQGINDTKKAVWLANHVQILAHAAAVKVYRSK
jgi:hypothetical protein